MAHNDSGNSNRFLRDTGKERPPSSSRQSQRRRLTGSPEIGGLNTAQRYVSDLAAEGFTGGWDNLSPTLSSPEIGDARRHPTAGPGLQPLDGGVNLYSPSGHLDSGPAYHTAYGGYVPGPYGLAPDPGWTPSFSSADSQADFTEQQSLWDSSITGPSGGEMDLSPSFFHENIDSRSGPFYHTAYDVPDPSSLAPDPGRTPGFSSADSQTDFTGQGFPSTGLSYGEGN